MKTKLKKIILICMTFAFVFLFGCSNSQKNNETQNILQNSLSEYRKNLFVGKTDNFIATFSSGKREDSYIMDGNKTKLVNFGVLTITFIKNPDSTSPQFELKVNTNTYAGELERNPYDNTFVYDIETQVDDKNVLTLYVVDFDEYITLDCLSKNWNITYQKSLEIFKNKYKKEINTHTNNNVLQGEIYIKIVSSDKQLKNIYWYVLLVCKNGDMYATLIDTKTGDILQN